MSKEQKDDLFGIFSSKWKNAGNLDYVACWYKKAADYMLGTTIESALVSTNSVTQGESVANLWKPLFEKGIVFNFAHRTFRWDSEANIKAHVHCVIVGFSYNERKTKIIYDNNYSLVNNINGYLIDADNVFIESRKKSICNVSQMVFGSMPNDGGYLVFSKQDADEFLHSEPKASAFMKPFIGSEEFINKKERFCLWLKDASPADIRTMPKVIQRVEQVRSIRLSSNRESTKRLADTPMLFGEIRQPTDGNYLLVPRVSSEKRRYIPMGFLDFNTIASDAVQIIPDATIYHFGVLTSNVHMAWMRTVCGRLEMRYRYSKDIVYNNFPWPTPTEEQKAKIEQTAQAILDARALFPECSLADLYDELTMPPELRKAHQENDRAVMAAYGFSIKITESECVAELMKMYKELTADK